MYKRQLQDKYQRSSAEAGPAATLWSSVAKYVAVLGGAILADMWYRRNARARARVPGITFTISGPLVVLARLPGIFGWDITVPLVLMLGLVATQGLAQGSLDATPVSYTHLDVYKRQPEYGRPFPNFPARRKTGRTQGKAPAGHGHAAPGQ